jgi:hypothetical protein
MTTSCQEKFFSSMNNAVKAFEGLHNTVEPAKYVFEWQDQDSLPAEFMIFRKEFQADHGSSLI